LTLRLFLDFGALQQTLQNLSTMQFLQLSNTVLPPGPTDVQLAHLVSLQAVLAEWGADGLAAAHSAVAAAPPLCEKSALLTCAQRTPIALLHLLVELLKLPLHDCERFRLWSQATSHKQLIYIVRLLANDPAVVLHVKHVLAPDVFAPADNNDDAAAHAIAASAAAAAAAASSTSSSAYASTALTSQLPSGGVSIIAVATHPPAETVYNRLLKPYPAVRVTGDVAGQQNYFVECSCVDAATHVEIPMCLQGTTRVKLLPTAFAQFKKLKLALTTQQQGCQFRLRFQMQTYSSAGYVNIPGGEAFSVPITVYSHTQYLGRNDVVSPIASTLRPQLSEVIPNGAAPGARLCLLGSGFVRSPQLRARIGGMIVAPTFHETGTLVCQVPPHCPRGTIAVAVSNDGVTWSEDVALQIV
jgi:hypothetical protein